MKIAEPQRRGSPDNSSPRAIEDVFDGLFGSGPVRAASSPPAGENQMEVTMDGDRLQVLANVDAEGARELLKAIQAYLALLEDENDVEVAPVRAVAPQVSLMITQAQRAKLREMGHDDETISNMTPAEAHKTLGILD